MKLKNLLNIKRQLNKPEYFYRPSQILKRLKYTSKARKKVNTPIDTSGFPFFVNENEVVGKSILTMGVYDLIVAETLFRLLKAGDTYVDAGANIGYFSRIAAELKTHVYSFEPHPEIYKNLSENLKDYSLETFNCALSTEAGQFSLYIPEDFDSNEGIASLEPIENSREIKVTTKTLDSFNFEKIDVIKIDVEGHELAVLKGSTELLNRSLISNIVFEDFKGADSEVISFLRKFGYSIFLMEKKLRGPNLLPLEKVKELPQWEPPNFLATLDSKTTLIKFQERGWKFLSYLGH